MAKKAVQAINVFAGLTRSYSGRARKALRIMQELQDWLDDHADSFPPVANVAISRFTVSVAIDEICLWHSEGDNESDLTFEYCRGAYLADIRRKSAIIGPKKRKKTK